MQIPAPKFVDYFVNELIKPFMFVTYTGIVVWWFEGFFISSCLLISSTLFFLILNYHFIT